MARIGVQAMMLKSEFVELGAFETLRKVREIGYREVEISQIAMTADNVAELRRARDELGLHVAALSAALSAPVGFPVDSLERDFDKIVADAHTLDTAMVRIGMLPMEAMADLERVLDFCDRTNAIARRLGDEGIALHYHNHHVDFAKYGGRHLLDIIADRAPDVGLEIDVHWVQRGGLDPVATLRKYAGRVAMVHLKDYRIGHLAPEAVAAASGGDVATFKAAFAALVQFAEVGEGNLDFPAIIPAAVDAGARYLLVEQDELYGRTALDCLETSHRNLTSMGFADLF